MKINITSLLFPGQLILINIPVHKKILWNSFINIQFQGQICIPSIYLPHCVILKASFSYTLPRAIISIKLTTAADMLAIIWARGRVVGFWNKGMLTSTRYMMTAMINIITKVIWNNMAIFYHENFWLTDWLTGWLLGFGVTL